MTPGVASRQDAAPPVTAGEGGVQLIARHRHDQGFSAKGIA
jgi:hypothetical protein